MLIGQYDSSALVDGRDDDQPARIRETFVVAAGSVQLLKETAIASRPMGFRHQYQLKRAQ